MRDRTQTHGHWSLRARRRPRWLPRPGVRGSRDEAAWSRSAIAQMAGLPCARVPVPQRVCQKSLSPRPRAFLRGRWSPWSRAAPRRLAFPTTFRESWIAVPRLEDESALPPPPWGPASSAERPLLVRVKWPRLLCSGRRPAPPEPSRAASEGLCPRRARPLLSSADPPAAGRSHARGGAAFCTRLCPLPAPVRRPEPGSRVPSAGTPGVRTGPLVPPHTSLYSRHGLLRTLGEL